MFLEEQSLELLEQAWDSGNIVGFVVESGLNDSYVCSRLS